MVKRCAISLLGILMTMQAIAGAGMPVDAPVAEPLIQSQIRQTVRAIVDVSAGGSEEVVLVRIERLHVLVDADRERLLLQIAAFLSVSKGTELSMGGALLLDHLAFTDEEKISTVLPQLDTTDRYLKKVLQQLLATIDRIQSGVPDFDPYLPALRERLSDPPLALIRYMYDLSPEVTVQTLRRVLPDGSYCESIDWPGEELLCGPFPRW
jgi:hypothetical protein